MRLVATPRGSRPSQGDPRLTRPVATLRRGIWAGFLVFLRRSGAMTMRRRSGQGHKARLQGRRFAAERQQQQRSVTSYAGRGGLNVLIRHSVARATMARRLASAATPPPTRCTCTAARRHNSTSSATSRCRTSSTSHTGLRECSNGYSGLVAWAAKGPLQLHGAA